MQNRKGLGYIYVIRLLDSPYLFSTKSKRGCSYKIGRSYTPDSRTRTLGILMPYETEVITIFPTIGDDWAERYIHGKLAHLRTNGEWFQLTRPMFEWLITLGSVHTPDLMESDQATHDSLFAFYADRLHYDSE